MNVRELIAELPSEAPDDWRDDRSDDRCDERDERQGDELNVTVQPFETPPVGLDDLFDELLSGEGYYCLIYRKLTERGGHGGSGRLFGTNPLCGRLAIDFTVEITARIRGGKQRDQMARNQLTYPPAARLAV